MPPERRCCHETSERATGKKGRDGATFWAHPNVGLRGSFLWYSHAVEPGLEKVELLGEDPDVFKYSGDIVLRFPMPARANWSWYPYVLGGIGGKTYDFQTLGNQSDVAGNFGVAAEVRLGQNGRWGLHTEVHDYISNFVRAGVDETLDDLIWMGGLSINF